MTYGCRGLWVMLKHNTMHSLFYRATLSSPAPVRSPRPRPVKQQHPPSVLPSAGAGVLSPGRWNVPKRPSSSSSQSSPSSTISFPSCAPGLHGTQAAVSSTAAQRPLQPSACTIWHAGNKHIHTKGSLYYRFCLDLNLYIQL